MTITCTDTLRRGLAGDTLEHFYKLQVNYGDAIMSEYFDDRIRTVTFREFGEQTRAAAGVLRERFGVHRIGSFVALQMDNSPYYYVAFWALLMAGYKPVLLDVNAPPALLEHILKQTGATAMVTNNLNVPDDIVRITPSEIIEPAKYHNAFRAKWANEYALCTSGTTASSKIYVFNGKSLRDQFGGAKSLCTSECKVLHDGAIRGLAFLPLHHVFGFYGMLVLFNLFGKTVVYLKDRSPATIQETCKRHKVTHILAVPLFWNNVAQGIVRKAQLMGRSAQLKLNAAINVSLYLQRRLGAKGRRIANSTLLDSVQENLLGPDVQQLISGGGHVLPETLRIINGVGYSLMCGFGMTECGITGVVTADDLELKLSNSIGGAFYLAEYKILPSDPAVPNVGELLIRGASMHIGRMVDGLLLPPDVDAEGWLHSGDLARMDKGRVWIEGRIKEVIIGESGENVYPDELEDYFINLPGVEQFCVTGINRNGRTEEIALVVDLKGKEDEGSIATLADAVAQAATLLPLHKRIRYLFVTQQPLPVVNGIKVARGKLKKLIEDNAWKYLEVDVAGRRIAVSTEKAAPKLVMSTVPEYNSVLFEVKKIFGEVLSLSPAEIAEDAHFIYDLGGDSLASLDVFTKVEEKYSIMINDNEYLSCVNARDLANLVCAKHSGIDLDANKPKHEAPVTPITRFEDSHEYKEFQKRLESLKGSDNPYFVAFDSALTDTSVFKDRRVVNYGSYNYICLSGHPDTIRAAKEAADKYGTSASGSRLLAGEKPLHRELEAAIAKWKHTEAALVLVGGHSTNVTFVGNFCTPNDLILYDALSHNSIMQGCQLSKGESKGFPHNDTKALENILKNHRDKYEKVLIVVEGAYSMDGDIAPIPEFVRIKKQYGCFLMVDEAHSSCVIGKTGGGVDEYYDLAPDDIDVKMGTLSKGLGTCGGYLAGSRALIEFLKISVPGFVFSVGLSPVLAAATLEGLEVMQREPERFERLHRNINDFIELAHSYFFDTCLAAETAIVPILIGSDADAFLLSKLLLDEGVFVPPAVYPAVPKNQARLRFCLTSDHSKEQAEQAMKTLDRLCREHHLKVPRKTYS